jgi:hypothetical protein
MVPIINLGKKKQPAWKTRTSATHCNKVDPELSSKQWGQLHQFWQMFCQKFCQNSAVGSMIEMKQMYVCGKIYVFAHFLLKTFYFT